MGAASRKNEELYQELHAEVQTAATGLADDGAKIEADDAQLIDQMATFESQLNA